MQLEPMNSCVQAKLHKLASGWNTVVDLFENVKSGLCNFMPGQLTTISTTVTVSTSSDPVGREKVYSALVGNTTIAMRPKAAKQATRSKKPSVFQNSASLQYKGPYPNQKCVKVFRNGRLHITGSKTAEELRLTLVETCKLLDQLNGRVVCVNDFDVNMLNLQFYLGKELDIAEVLVDLRQAATAKDSRIQSVEYNPDKCQALMVKHRMLSESEPEKAGVAVKSPRVITLMIYRKGCVKVYGLREYEDAIDALRFLLTFVDVRVGYFVQST